jgi:hypothetical protein
MVLPFSFLLFSAQVLPFQMCDQNVVNSDKMVLVAVEEENVTYSVVTAKGVVICNVTKPIFQDLCNHLCNQLTM